MPAHLHTSNLYKFDDVVSALQKSIRRGDVEQSLFWAGELQDGFVPTLMSRMWTIIAEDIGLAAPFLALDLFPLYQQWQAIHKTNPREGQALCLQMVYVLAKAPKNRIVDNLLLYNYFQTKPSAEWHFQLPSKTLALNIEHLFAVNLFATVEEKEIDVSAALMQFAACLEKGAVEDAYFFANLIQLSTEENSRTPWLVQYLGLPKGIKIESKIAKKMSGHCWYVLFEICKQNASLFELLKVLYQLNLAKTGSPSLYLSFAVLLCCHRDKLVYQATAIPPVAAIPEKEQALFYNRGADILKRRLFHIPDYAIDKHTDRGKGSDFVPHNIADLHTEAQRHKIPTYLWSEAEIAKSHGAFKKFEAFVQHGKHSRMSHFFVEGAKLNQVPDDWTGEDPYAELIVRYFLSLERKYDYKACSGFFILEKMRPIWVASQALWVNK